MVNSEQQKPLETPLQFNYLELFPSASQEEIEEVISQLLALDKVIKANMPTGDLTSSELVQALVQKLAEKIPLLPAGQTPTFAPIMLKLPEDTDPARKQYLLGNLYVIWCNRHPDDTSDDSDRHLETSATQKKEPRSEVTWRKQLREQLKKAGSLSPALELLLLDLHHKRAFTKNIVRLVMVGIGTFAAINHQSGGRVQDALGRFLKQDFDKAQRIFQEQGFREGLKHQVFEAERAISEVYGNETGGFYARFFSMTEECLSNPACDIFEQWSSGKIISPIEMFMVLEFPDQAEALIAQSIRRIVTFETIPNAVTFAISEISTMRQRNSNERHELFEHAQARQEALIDAGGTRAVRSGFEYQLSTDEVTSFLEDLFVTFSSPLSDNDMEALAEALLITDLTNSGELPAYLRIEEGSLSFSVADFYTFLATNYPELVIGDVSVKSIAASHNNSPRVNLPDSPSKRLSIVSEVVTKTIDIFSPDNVLSLNQRVDLSTAYFTALDRGIPTYTYAISQLVRHEIARDASPRLLVTPSREAELFSLFSRFSLISSALENGSDMAAANFLSWLVEETIFNPAFSDTASLESFIEAEATALGLSSQEYIHRHVLLESFLKNLGIRQMYPAEISTFMHRWYQAGSFPAEGEAFVAEVVPWEAAYLIYQPEEIARELGVLFKELELNQAPSTLRDTVFSRQALAAGSDILRLEQLVFAGQFLSTDLAPGETFFAPHGLRNQVREFIQRQPASTRIFLTDYWLAKGNQLTNNSYRTQSASRDLMAELHTAVRWSEFFAHRTQRERTLLAETMAVLSSFSKLDTAGIELTEPITQEIASQVVEKAQAMYLTHDELKDLVFFVFQRVLSGIESPNQDLLLSGDFKEIGDQSPLAVAKLDLATVDFHRVGATIRPDENKFMLPIFYSGPEDHSLAISLQSDGSMQVEGDDVSILTKELLSQRYPQMHYLVIAQDGNVRFSTTEEIAAEMEAINAESLEDWFISQNLRVFFRVAPVHRDEQGRIITNKTLEFGQTWGRFFLFVATTNHQEFGAEVMTEKTRLVFLEPGRALDAGVLSLVAADMGVEEKEVVVFAPDVDVPSHLKGLTLGGYAPANRIDPTIPNNAKNEYPALIFTLN